MSILCARDEAAVDELMKAIDAHTCFSQIDFDVIGSEHRKGLQKAAWQYQSFANVLGVEITNRLERTVRPLLEGSGKVELEGGVVLDHKTYTRTPNGEVSRSVDLIVAGNPTSKLSFNESENPPEGYYSHWLVINRLPRDPKAIFSNYLLMSSYFPTEAKTERHMSVTIQKKNFSDMIQAMDGLKKGLASKLAEIAEETRNRVAADGLRAAVLKAIEADGGLPGIICQEAFVRLMKRNLKHVHGNMVEKMPNIIKELDDLDVRWGDRDLSHHSYDWRMTVLTQEGTDKKALFFTERDMDKKTSIQFLDTDDSGNVTESHLYQFRAGEEAIAGALAFINGEPILGAQSSYHYGEHEGISHYDGEFIDGDGHDFASSALYVADEETCAFGRSQSCARLSDDFRDFLEDHGVWEYEIEEKINQSNRLSM